jgi:hypothetical protein
LKHLGDVDERHALLTRGQRRRHPVDVHVGTAAGHDLRRTDIGAAGLNRYVESRRFIEAFGLRDIVTRELRLCDPLEL